MTQRCFSIPIVLGILLAGLGRSDARQAVTTNLAAYWPLDSFASNATPDASGGGHDATQSTASKQPTTAPGLFAGALDFDGTDDFLSAPDSPGLNVGSGSFTVAAWVKRGGTTADRILNKWDNTKGWLFDINAGSGGAVSPGFVRIKMSDGTNNVDYFVDAGLSTGAWTHLAATIDRTAKQLKLYANGTQIGTTQTLPAALGSLTNGAALGIGTIPTNAGNNFDGALDEVRLYTAALTQAQVLTLVQPLPPTALTGTPPPPTTPGRSTWPGPRPRARSRTACTAPSPRAADTSRSRRA
ncbi:MAG: LamG domain-containing protein [Planctomycetaceae bacterium]|nr:LamG domain-containing protein [Planctomycetaceae bacterium]